MLHLLVPNSLKAEENKMNIAARILPEKKIFCEHRGGKINVLNTFFFLSRNREER